RPKLPAPVQRYTATADTRSSHSWKRHPKAWLHLAEACSRSLGLPLARKRCPRRDKLLLLCRIDLRVAQVEILDRFHDRGGDDEPGEPLVVRGHDEPRVLAASRWRGLLPRRRACSRPRSLARGCRRQRTSSASAAAPGAA